MKLDIALKHNSPREEQVKHALLELIAKYKIDKSIYNTRILIDEQGHNNSSPLISMNTRHLNSPGQLLAQFLNLQMHCFLSWRRADLDNAVAKLETQLPGSHTKIECKQIIAGYLEYEELKKILGEQATAIISNKEENTEIYVLVLDEHNRIKPIIEDNKLIR